MSYFLIHLILFGILLGLGAAIPIGPINLEITRRNLYFGINHGLFLGLGACLADVTYLILLCTGTLIFLKYPLLFKMIGFLGSFMLAWFGICALRHQKMEDAHNSMKKSSLLNGVEGYVMTILNPYTILFWVSVSSQIAVIASDETRNTVFTGFGVIIGTVSWVLFLNILLHFTRHRFNYKTMRGLNITGGIILIGFSLLGLYHAINF